MERAHVPSLGAPVTAGRPRLLFLITEDWYFWSHRLDLARAARDAGFEVSIATRVTDHRDRITKEGFRLFPITLERRSRNPLVEGAAILQLIRIYHRLRPHIAHHVALKPILYGSVAAWLSRVPAVINAFAGLGYLFTDQGRVSPLQRLMIRMVLKRCLALRRSTVLFQNYDDRACLVREGVVPVERTRVIAGSGVNTEVFQVRPAPAGCPLVLLASRMLWDKGVGEFVEAVRVLRRSGRPARYVLVGRCDEHNPAAIARRQLAQWVDEGVVEWWQHRDDMPEVYAQATVVVLPSYREGLPKTLLEAAASGRPLIATDVPGCREIVQDGVNGYLVPARHPQDLARAIEAILHDRSLQERMGQDSRDLVVRNFSTEKIAGQVLALYRETLSHREPALSCL